MTRDTVAVDTPATRATSRNPILRPLIWLSRPHAVPFDRRAALTQCRAIRAGELSIQSRDFPHSVSRSLPTFCQPILTRHGHPAHM
jgi:hypothetical protein